jgi:hypothetical protein
MNNISIILPLLYLLFVLGLCTYLLIRGITHSFVAAFACAAFLQMIPHIGFLVLHELPGGFAANAQYYPILSIFGALGILCFAIGFALEPAGT